MERLLFKCIYIFSDQSETQRKRRSKNRLSNRRSTGYIPPEMVEEALKMGDQTSQNV